MEEVQKSSLLIIAKTLCYFGVEYLVVGGTAVALNGYYRNSVDINGNLSEKPDIDIWFNPTYENYFKLLKAIEKLGQDVSAFFEEKEPDPRKSYFKLTFDTYTLDLLPMIKADISFSEANSRKQIVTSDNTNIFYLSYEDLLNDKRASARAKDISDIEQLNYRRGID